MATDKSIREWAMELPEPYRSKIIAECTRQKGDKGLNIMVSSRAQAIMCFADWSRTEDRNCMWNYIYRGLNSDPEYLHKLVLEEGGTLEASASKPEASASTTTTTTTTKETTMKNGTYDINKLIAKAELELKNNAAAVAKFNTNAASRKAAIDTIKAQLKASPTTQAPEGCTIEVASVTLKFTGPAVTNNVAKLEAAIRSLSALAGTEIGWNDDIAFILSDFSEANGATTKTVEVTVTAEK